jgi:ABC-2 type transport system permease protein
VSPVLSTSLYFVVFGPPSASRIDQVEGVSYGAFIVPGLIMLTVLQQSISNAAFGIYFPKFIGTIYELLSAPVSFLEIGIGYVGAAATKALIIGLIILRTSFFFVDLTIAHPVWMLAFLVLTCLSFALFGFIIGIWAQSFEQLQLVPLLIDHAAGVPRRAFYSISMLPPVLADVTPVQPGGLSDLRASAGRSSASRTCPSVPLDQSKSPSGGSMTTRPALRSTVGTISVVKGTSVVSRLPGARISRRSEAPWLRTAATRPRGLPPVSQTSRPIRSAW